MSSSSSSSSASNEYPKRLNQAMRAMYVAANFFKEINAKKEQKKSLENIQKSLPTSSFAANNESSEKLTGTIHQLQQDIEHLERKLHTTEKDITRFFHEAINQLANRSVREGDERVESTLRRKLVEADSNFNKKTEEIKADIKSLYTNKLNVDEGNKKIADLARESQAQCSQMINEQVEGLRTQNKAAFTELRDKYTSLSSNQYKDQLKSEISNEVAEYVKRQFRPEQLLEIKKCVMELVEKTQKSQSTSSPTPKPTSATPVVNTEMIQSEIQKYIENEDALRKQLNELDEWNILKNKLKDLEKKVDKGSGIGSSSMTVVQHLRNDMGELNRKIDLIKQSVDAVINKSATPDQQRKQMDIFNKRIQDIARDLQINGSVMEMATMGDRVDETELTRGRRKSPLSVNDASTEKERQKKRQRTDNNGAITSRDHSNSDNDIATTINDNNNLLEEKILTLEQKQTSLTEYIDSFRSNVLNPEFPQRLQTIMTDIEMSLRSHEEIIAHLVDPVRASQGTTPSIDLTRDNNSIQIPQTLSPAMIQAIQALVASTAEKTAEQTAKPLLERISTLEAKLNQRN
ncbi:hypothetical protein INT45_008841 [Circinella minor]|uniref:Uncharacterized protein n=1 Tax=Circinella minor TaxID=1195481 RepID=A0A8H7S2I2_9FUNG|nr:hypothetical protein INT45_008841 [Circinella minor]